MKALAHLKTNLISSRTQSITEGTYPMLRIEKSRRFATVGNIKLYKDRIPYMATTTAVVPQVRTVACHSVVYCIGRSIRCDQEDEATKQLQRPRELKQDGGGVLRRIYEK
jgi:hypothetical protein